MNMEVEAGSSDGITTVWGDFEYCGKPRLTLVIQRDGIVELVNKCEN